MTVLADAPPDQEPGSPVAVPLRRPAAILRRVGALVFVSLIVVLVAVLVVEDAVAHVWYVSRQQHLTAQYIKASKVHPGDALSVVQVPSQGINLTVVEGDGPGEMRGAPGHRPGTPRPGDLGNSIVFGHRSGWGGPFSDLAKVVVGDNIFVQSKSANGPDSGAVFFRVASVRTVSDTDRRPFATSDDHRLTLVTSTSSSRRLIVVAASGPVGHLAAPGPRTEAATGAVGPALTWSVLELIAAVAALVVVVAIGRRRGASRSVVVVAAPLVLGALLAVVLAADALLRSPLA